MADQIVATNETVQQQFPIYALASAWFNTLPNDERTAIELGLQTFVEIVASPTEAMQAEDVKIYLEAHREFRIFAASQKVEA